MSLWPLVQLNGVKMSASIPKNPTPRHLVTPRNLVFVWVKVSSKLPLHTLRSYLSLPGKNPCPEKGGLIFFSALPCLKCSVSVKQSCWKQNWRAPSEEFYWLNTIVMNPTGTISAGSGIFWTCAGVLGARASPSILLKELFKDLCSRSRRQTSVCVIRVLICNINQVQLLFRGPTVIRHCQPKEWPFRLSFG